MATRVGRPSSVLFGQVADRAVAGTTLPSSWGAGAGETVVLRAADAPACTSCHRSHGEGGGEGLYPHIARLPAT
jgi:cytochrome c553